MIPQTSHSNGRKAEDRQVSARPLNLPVNADVLTPSPARMYDYYLGGKDNYAVDREAADEALSVVPDGRRIAQYNRRFLVRAVTHLAACGIEQFIDLGTGIPTSPNVHEVARSILPQARVVYVDNDPIVAVHNRALLESIGDGIIAVRGDIRYPLNILTNHEVRRVINFRQPVGVLFVAVLHFVTDSEAPYQAVTTFRDRLSPGSFIAISHITSDGTEPHVVNSIQEAYRHASAPAVFRSAADIRLFFAGFDLIEPGLVEVSEWRGHDLESTKSPALRFLGGVGQKVR